MIRGRRPSILFAGPTKSYAQYRKLLSQGTPVEQQWLAMLDDYRRRVGRHPSFLYAQAEFGIEPLRLASTHTASRRRGRSGATKFPARFQVTRRLLTTACCQGADYDACNANTSLCTEQSLASFQAPESQRAVANLARFYVEHFEPQVFASFAEMNFISGTAAWCERFRYSVSEANATTAFCRPMRKSSRP